MINDDIGVYLHGVWENILPPVNTDDIAGKCFACIYDSKKNPKIRYSTDIWTSD